MRREAQSSLDMALAKAEHGSHLSQKETTLLSDYAERIAGVLGEDFGILERLIGDKDVLRELVDMQECANKGAGFEMENAKNRVMKFAEEANKRGAGIDMEIVNQRIAAAEKIGYAKAVETKLVDMQECADEGQTYFMKQYRDDAIRYAEAANKRRMEIVNKRIAAAESSLAAKA
jgi:capsid portal protein